MQALDNLEKKFEKVSFFYDRELDFTAIIAVHSTILGPSLGGCRLKNYDSLNDALFDVLRLAEGMSYKNSLAGLNIGGGKSVIIPSQKALDNREKLFLKFGSWVESLGGSYITAEDMGTSLEDIKIISRVTKFVSGSDPSKGGGGDPSPYTAKGVFLGIGACLERVYGSADYKNKKVLIQGLGHVGYYLAKFLHEAGSKIIVADTNNEKLNKAKLEFEAEVCATDKIYDYPCDVFAPCAVGAILNADTTKRLKCSIVAGAANNQLSCLEDERTLKDRGILYAPDFAINSGGVINCAAELLPQGYSKEWVLSLVDKIGKTVGLIIDKSQDSGKLAGEVAIELAKERLRV